MNPAPAISVVIPTHDRAAVLRATLAALDRQSLSPERFEVIVVADGCRDATADVIRALTPAYRLTLVEQPHAGAATARNRGAARATAPLVLFLDDDMEATPELLAAHLAAQEMLPGGGVVLGRMTPVAGPRPDGLLAVETRLWWSAQTHEWSRPAHRFTARDLFAGNLSMPRTLFAAAGGFDDAFGDRAAEDHELGVRLLRLRAPFRFAGAAASLHHDTPTRTRLFARAESSGRGHVLIARRHPELLVELPLGAPVEGRLRRRWWDLGWRWPALAAIVAFALRHAVLPALDRARCRSPRGRLMTLLHDHAYWRGVRSEVGSRDAWEALRARAVAEPPGSTEREGDLAAGFEALAALLAAEPVDALRLRWGTTPIARIAPLPAAEPLRPIHVRAALVDSFATALLPLLAEDVRP